MCLLYCDFGSLRRRTCRSFITQPAIDEFGGDGQEADANIDILENAEPLEQGGGPRQRITTRYMTKYEKARVLGTRALQIR